MAQIEGEFVPPAPVVRGTLPLRRMEQLLAGLNQIRCAVAECIAVPSECREALICKQVREVSLPLCELALQRAVEVLNSTQCITDRGGGASTLRLQAYAEVVDDVICYVESLRDGYPEDGEFLENIEAKMARVGVTPTGQAKLCMAQCPSGVMDDLLADLRRSMQSLRSQLNRWQLSPTNRSLVREFMRQLHAMKGCVLVYGAAELIENIQRLESTAAAFLKGELKPCDALFELLVQYVSRLSVVVDLLRCEYLTVDGSEAPSPDPRDDRFDKVVEPLPEVREPFSAKLPRLYFLVERASVMLDKPVHLVVDGGSVMVPQLITEKLISPLELLLWNAIDHGIESRETRKSVGKSKYGEIGLSLALNGNGSSLTVSVRDDGGGIDLDAVCEQAQAAGLEIPAVDDLPATIFFPGLSTAQRISPVSGRGVGLDVVKTEIERLGGSVAVKSRRGEGTQFVLSIPLPRTLRR